MLESYRVEFIDHARKTNRTKGVCVMAESPKQARELAIAPEGYKYLQAIAVSTIARNQARYNKKLRDELLKAYGGRCQCPGGCPIRTPEFLNLDHSDNNGKADRKAKGRSTQFYRWLRRNGWPKDGYRLLCYNCNMSREKQPDKRCPHELKPRTRVRAI